MISYSTYSGKISINPLENNGYSIVLMDFKGTLTVDKTTKYIKFNLKGTNLIDSDISLQCTDKLDSIVIRGSGSCRFKGLRATSLTIQSNIYATQLYSNVTKISNCSVVAIENEYPNNPFIDAVGHIWIVDSSLIINNFRIGVKTPYMLLDNVKCSINCESKAIESNNPQVIEHCTDLNTTDYSFLCNPLVSDDEGNPLVFTQANIHDENGNLNIITRRNIYTYEPAYTPLNDYDIFREYIGYTNPDLHRRIDQNGYFEEPSIEPEKYEIGIRGIYSYRGTDKTYHDEKSRYDETP